MAISLHFGEPFLLKAGKELSRKTNNIANM
jgi:hypothetical protein